MRPVRRALLGFFLLVATAVPISTGAPRQSAGVLVGVDGATGKRLFRAETPGPAALSVTFAANGLVVAERRGCFSADQPDAERSTVLIGYDARSGHQRWQQKAGIVTAGVESGGWARLTPGVVPVRDVATGERMGVDPESGQIIWSRGVAADLVRASTPDLLVTSGAGVDGDRLTGVDRATGQTRWSYEVDGQRRVRLVAASDGVVVAVVGDPASGSFEEASHIGVAIHVLSATSGELQVQIPLEVQALQVAGMRSVAVLGSTVVIDIGELVAFDIRTGAERWRAPGHLDLSLPSPRPDVLLTRTGAGTGFPVSITALDPAIGRQLWVHELGRFIYGAAATKSSVVVFERDGYRGIAPKTGRPHWQLDGQRGVSGVSGMTARDLYLAGGCPVTSAD